MERLDGTSLSEIMRYLPLRDRNTAARVSRTWLKASKNALRLDRLALRMTPIEYDQSSPLRVVTYLTLKEITAGGMETLLPPLQEIDPNLKITGPLCLQYGEMAIERIQDNEGTWTVKLSVRGEKGSKEERWRFAETFPLGSELSVLREERSPRSRSRRFGQMIRAIHIEESSIDIWRNALAGKDVSASLLQK